jgi:hypothetical protein
MNHGGRVAHPRHPALGRRHRLEPGHLQGPRPQGHLRPRDVRDLVQDDRHAPERPRRDAGAHAPLQEFERSKPGMPPSARPRASRCGRAVPPNRRLRLLRGDTSQRSGSRARHDATTSQRESQAASLSSRPHIRSPTATSRASIVSGSRARPVHTPRDNAPWRVNTSHALAQASASCPSSMDRRLATSESWSIEQSVKTVSRPPMSF